MNYMNHNDGKRMLLELADVMDRTASYWFLIQGTALGAYRDNGFVPTEKDIDIGILWEDCHWPQLAKELITRKFEIQTISRPFAACRTIVAKKYGCKADLVGYIAWKEFRFAARPVDERNLPPYSIVHKAELLQPPYHDVALFGRSFQIPSPPEEYLALEYGDDWYTPREDHVSRTRVPNFVNKNVPLDLIW